MNIYTLNEALVLLPCFQHKKLKHGIKLTNVDVTYDYVTTILIANKIPYIGKTSLFEYNWKLQYDTHWCLFKPNITHWLRLQSERYLQTRLIELL